MGGITVLAALNLHAQTDTSVNELWNNMRVGGMLTQEQCEYAITYGCLPGGATVKNSPVPDEKQSRWNNLASKKVITPKELAQVLFNGAMPDMTPEENKAFEELAPVYQPDRAKRLGYELRRKHQKVELIRLNHQEKIRWTERYEEAVKKAKAAGLPLRVEKDGQISELFGWEHDQPLYFTTFNRVSAKTISTDTVRPGGTTSFALTGTNVIVAMWDGGSAVTNHQEFASGRVWKGNDISNAPVVAAHSTGVAGTMAAAGIDTNAQGMAYAAQVESYDWNYLIPEITACVISNDHIHISNHSYGLSCGWDNNIVFNGIWRYWRGDTRLSENEDYTFGWYQSVSQSMDQFCYIAPYHLPVYSAGNDRGEQNYGAYAPEHVYWNYSINGYDLSTLVRAADGLPSGYDCITPYGVSKNILTVGAVQDIPGGYTNGMNVQLESYSGTGPTDDGRIKPDVVANGQQLHTTYGTATNSYADVSGTSFAAPSVAGSLALIQELHDRIYGTEAPMFSSTLKGIAIHTARDIGPVGPDYTFGWGLMATPASALSVSNNAAWDSLPRIKEVSLRNGDKIEFKVSASTNEPLKVTIVWTDPAGPVQPWALDPTNRVLVNDLDLRIIAPNGVTNYPWVLNPQNPSAAATRGDNVLDNVEQVVVTPTSNTIYTVRVTHKGSLTNGVQDVSILLSGNIATNAPDFVIQENIADSAAQLEWPSVVGGFYRVQASADLTDTNGWSDAGTLSANREQLDWSDTDSTNQTVRFYRIKREK